LATETPSPPPHLRRLLTLAVGLAIWFVPPPLDISQPAWQLFAIFITAILAVVADALPILVAAVAAVAAAVLTGTLAPEVAYAGFSEGFILLIIVAFMVARGVVNSGLGKRIGFLLVSRFGQSTLRLAYCIFAADALMAPAFPSNTARSAVLFPIVQSLSVDANSLPHDESRKRLGSYLMMVGMASMSVSSALWMTAMAANPAGARLARDFGVEIGFGSWLLAASVPGFCALLALPALLYRLYPPQLRATPEAPAAATAELERMGPASRDEWTTGITFALMVGGWALGDSFGLDATAVAFLGLGVLMLTGVYRVDDYKSEGEALGILIWFSVLYALSSALNDMGFMGAVGDALAAQIAGLPWPVVYVLLVVLYVLIHYLFVSQSAQLFALFAVFAGVGIRAGVPAPLMTLMLLFATNFFSAITPQGSSANVIFIGSDYVTQREAYRLGACVTAANLVIWLGVGTPWILLLHG
jgi:DASS family divalent anion:Na+ symporter